MLKKSLLLVVLMAGFVGTASAEEPESLNAEVQDLQEVEATQQKTTVEVPAWVKNIKFSGYGMLQYQGQDPEGNHSNSFNLRLARFILDNSDGKTLSIRKVTIAESLGISYRHLEKLMNDLCTQKILEKIKLRYKIIDIKRLEELSSKLDVF